MEMLLTIFLVSLALASGQTEEPATVTIEQGMVIGSTVTSETISYFQFFGIPYADSTSGSHRFKAPLPAPAFTEAFVADRRGIKCVRALGVGYEGTEDCLVLDVFTPSLSNNSQLPVMVWIKGREFKQAAEPDISFMSLLEKEVVIVSLNFRESILGYLCLGTETAPGNAGLKDIIAGLRWVQENIAEFGGDPNSVTIFGHGTGAAAVDLVTLSPMAEGLVHRAIAQSGNSMAPWAVTRDPTKYAILVAEALGHSITDIESLSDVFARTSVAALMAVINELDLTDNSLAFAPCIENEYLESDEKFLMRSPFTIISDGDFLQIPFIFGFVENEGTIRADEAYEHNWLEKMDISFIDFIQPDLQFETDEEEEIIAQEIRTFYFDDRVIDMENVADYIKYHGDTMILVSAIREARLRAAASLSPTYLYEFSYQGTLGEAFVGEMSLSIVGATHSEELAYILDTNIPTETTSLDIEVKRILIDRWTNFAKTGVPTSEISNTIWQYVTAETTNVLLIRNDESLNRDQESILDVTISNPHSEALLFWDWIYANHFLDAEGKWEPSIREEEEDIDVDGEEDEIDEDDATTSPDTDEDNVTTAPDTDETEPDGETGSACTAVGSTFVILAFFAVVDKFHISQILSF